MPTPMTTPPTLTARQFFDRYGINDQSAKRRIACPSPGDIPLDDLSFTDILPAEESPISPEVSAESPAFADELTLTGEAIDDALPTDSELEPEWMQDFDPWVAESIRRNEAMKEASGLYGTLPYIGGVL